VADPLDHSSVFQYLFDAALGFISAIVISISGFIIARMWNQAEHVSRLAQDVRDLRETVMRLHAELKSEIELNLHRLDSIDSRVPVILAGHQDILRRLDIIEAELRRYYRNVAPKTD
jgi:hypothetical protein